MDKYTVAYIKVHVHIDAGNRVFCKGQELEVHVIGGERKVVLPIGKITYTFDQLKRAGARCEGQTVRTLALAGAEGRWKDQIEARRDAGLPSNVYVANARSISYALEKGRVAPQVMYVGRSRDRITETRATVDEVVADMAEGRWRTEFSRGGKARRK